MSSSDNEDRDYRRSKYQSPSKSSILSPPRSPSSGTRTTYKTTYSTMSVTSPLDKLHDKEMTRISELYEDTKDEFKRTQREIRDIEERQKQLMDQRERDHNSELRRLNKLLDELRDQIQFNDNQLSKSRMDTSNLQMDLRECSDKLKKTESLLQIKTDLLKLKEEQILDMHEQLDDVQKGNEEALNKSTHDLYEAESRFKSSELKASLAESKLKDQESELRYLSRINEKNSSKLDELEEFKREQEVNSKKAQRELEETRDRLERVKSKQLEKVERSILVDQLKKDNARLAKLLYSTGQYKELFEYRDDHPGGISYIGDDTRIDDSDAPSTHGNGHSYADRDTPSKEAQEWKFWVPQDAYDLAKSFQNKYLSDIREDIFAELLIKLNNVWHRKETRKIQELKAKHLEDLKTLRRQSSQKQSYDDVVNLDRIDYLKKELKKSKSPTSLRYREMEGAVLDTTLSELEKLSKELNDYRRENRELRHSLKGSKNNSFSKGEEVADAAFLDGAAWMGRKVVDSADRMSDKITTLALEYQQSVIMESGRSNSSSSKLTKLQGTFLENLEKTVVAFRERLRILFEKVLESLEQGNDAEHLRTSRLPEVHSDDE